jgi:transposase
MAIVQEQDQPVPLTMQVAEATAERRFWWDDRVPGHLERVQVINAVPPLARICPTCGSEMTTVGHSKCEKLDVVPARIVVVERLDERVACPKDDTIVSEVSGAT